MAKAPLPGLMAPLTPVKSKMARQTARAHSSMPMVTRMSGSSRMTKRMATENTPITSSSRSITAIGRMTCSTVREGKNFVMDRCMRVSSWRARRMGLASILGPMDHAIRASGLIMR